MTSGNTFAAAQTELLRLIAEEVEGTAQWTGRPSLSPAVIAALREVPRHKFVSPIEAAFAYDNRPLGIGFGQTISQPYIVAIMSELLDLTADDRVLEIGTGSGYQSAILSRLARDVYSVETIPTLATTAIARMTSLGYENVRVRIGDGYRGWPEEAPFDAIIVTAAPPEIPETLVTQLKEGGRLVIPVGPIGERQMLYRCVKGPDGKLETAAKLPVAFVPMVHG
ncbi:MAG: protein-L-isoaspartate(D-aspartate) O-methyltransferase [Rhodospirillales bacterium]|nr:protein-L-isoaspartate(D-aspartate) O-methyltransferase [Rhodospirillales bacterium]